MVTVATRYLGGDEDQSVKTVVHYAKRFSRVDTYHMTGDFSTVYVFVFPPWCL